MKPTKIKLEQEKIKSRPTKIKLKLPQDIRDDELNRLLFIVGRNGFFGRVTHKRECSETGFRLRYYLEILPEEAADEED